MKHKKGNVLVVSMEKPQRDLVPLDPYGSYQIPALLLHLHISYIM